jgi:hypothetical protein
MRWFWTIIAFLFLGRLRDSYEEHTDRPDGYYVSDPDKMRRP